MTYYPVCDDVTGITYITPCHAGCTDYQFGDDGKVKVKNSHVFIFNKNNQEYRFNTFLLFACLLKYNKHVKVFFSNVVLQKLM